MQEKQQSKRIRYISVRYLLYPKHNSFCIEIVRTHLGESRILLVCHARCKSMLRVMLRFERFTYPVPSVKSKEFGEFNRTLLAKEILSFSITWLSSDHKSLIMT